MISTLTPTTVAYGTRAEVVDLVVDLLANLLGKTPADLRAELVASGAAMPVDSLDLLDVLAEFRLATGFRLPKRDLRRSDMRSLEAFADFVLRSRR